LEARVKSNEIEDDEKTIDMCGLFSQEHPLFGIEPDGGSAAKDGHQQQLENFQSRPQMYEIAEVNENQQSQGNLGAGGEPLEYLQQETFMKSHMMGGHQQQLPQQCILVSRSNVDDMGNGSQHPY